MKKLLSKLAILVVMVTNLPFSGLSALALTERTPDQAAIGIISESAAKSTKVSNIFGVLSSQARRTKQRIFSVLDSDIDMNKLGRVLSENGGNKTAFFENLSLLDNVNIKRVVKDEKLMKRMIEDTGFYKKFDISEVYDGNTANGFFPEYDNPLPFPPNKNALEFTITEDSLDKVFIRLHKGHNQSSPFVFREKDLPYLTSGKIDLAETGRMLNMNTNGITTISRYEPGLGEVLIEGSINGGNDDKVMQYAIIDLNDSTKFEIDEDLTNNLI